MRYLVWCYRCGIYFKKAHAFSSSYECPKCKVEVRVKRNKEVTDNQI